MKKAIVIIISSIVLITGITFVVVYNVGEMVLNDVISNEINNDFNVVDSTIENEDKNAQDDTVVDSDINSSNNVDNDEKSDGAKTKRKKNITVKEIEEIKNSITGSDKISAALIVINRLNITEINTLKNIMSNGITLEEKKEAKRIIYSKFTSGEIATLKAIYRKYIG